MVPVDHLPRSRLAEPLQVERRAAHDLVTAARGIRRVGVDMRPLASTGGGPRLDAAPRLACDRDKRCCGAVLGLWRGQRGWVCCRRHIDRPARPRDASQFGDLAGRRRAAANDKIKDRRAIGQLLAAANVDDGPAVQAALREPLAEAVSLLVIGGQGDYACFALLGQGGDEAQVAIGHQDVAAAESFPFEHSSGKLLILLGRGWRRPGRQFGVLANLDRLVGWRVAARLFKTMHHAPIGAHQQPPIGNGQAVGPAFDRQINYYRQSR